MKNEKREDAGLYNVGVRILDDPDTGKWFVDILTGSEPSVEISKETLALMARHGFVRKGPEGWEVEEKGREFALKLGIISTFGEKRRQRPTATETRTGFFEKTEKLDKLKSLSDPRGKDLQHLLEVVHDDDEAARYFFEKNEEAGWLALLEEGRQFKGLGARAEEIGEVEWAKADYLTNVAEKEPNQVLQVIKAAGARNHLIQGKLLDAMLKMPVEVAADATSVVCKYLERRDRKDWYFLGERAAKLMVAFSKGALDQALEVGNVLLEVWREKKRRRRLLSEIGAKFTPFEYQELLQRYHKKLWEVDAFAATRQLVEVFNSYLEELGKGEDYDARGYLPLMVEDLDNIYWVEKDIVAAIVAGICEAGRATIERQLDKIGPLLNYLEGTGKVIFQRIVMYLLRFVPKGMEGPRIDKIIAERKHMVSRNCLYEYRLLLRDRFEDVEEEARKVFEDWLKEPKLDDEERKRFKAGFKDKHGREAQDEDIRKFEMKMRAEELYLIRERYRTLFDQFLEEAGVSENEVAPQPSFAPGEFISPTEGSPRTVDELMEMAPEEVIAYLKDSDRWGVAEKKWYFHTPEQGLTAAFKEVVKRRSEKYVSLEPEEIASLAPIFIRDYFYVLREVVQKEKVAEGFWPSALGVAGCVVDKHRKDENSRTSIALLAVLGLVEEGLGKGPAPMEVTKENFKAAWGIAETLLDYSYGSDLSEEGIHDLYTGALNCVQGQALRLAIRVAMKAKRELPEYFDRFLETSVRDVLKLVVFEIRKQEVNSVLGAWFLNVHWLDTEWVEANLDTIFDDKDKVIWDAAWGSFIQWGRPSRETFELLATRGKYGFALERLGDEEERESREEQDRRLVEHLMIAFFNGWLEKDERGLLQVLMQKARPGLLTRAAEFLSTGFRELKENPNKETSMRLLRYWESRLRAMNEKREENLEEALGFTGWIEDCPFESNRFFALLRDTLELTDGEIGEPRMFYEFVEDVAEIAVRNELAAIQCITRVLIQPKNRVTYFKIEPKFDALIQRIRELPNNYPRVDEIHTEAMKMANAFGKKHLEVDKFRKLYDELSKKPKEA